MVLSNLFVSQCRKHSRPPKSSGAEIFLFIRGGYQFFPLKVFLSHSAIKFCGESFNVSEKIGHRKILYIRRRNHHFLFKFFISLCQKICGEPLNVTEVFE